MRVKEWNRAPTSESMKLVSGKGASTFNITISNNKAFCSQCTVLGILPFCEWCWYSNFMQGNFDLAYVGA